MRKTSKFPAGIINSNYFLSLVVLFFLFCATDINKIHPTAEFFMAKKNLKKRDRQIGKTRVAGKKHLIDPRYKNAFWTTMILIILLIFFIINNTRDVPETGPYPPGYNPQKAEKKLVNEP